MNAQQLKTALLQGQTVTFSNANTTKTDVVLDATCSHRTDPRNSWRNGFELDFNGQVFPFKRFKEFKTKLDQLCLDNDLELVLEEVEG